MFTCGLTLGRWGIWSLAQKSATAVTRLKNERDRGGAVGLILRSRAWRDGLKVEVESLDSQTSEVGNGSKTRWRTYKEGRTPLHIWATDGRVLWLQRWSTEVQRGTWNEVSLHRSVSNTSIIKASQRMRKTKTHSDSWGGSLISSDLKSNEGESWDMIMI